jgi:S-adenosylmethionine decarboxylase proenzyme
LLAARDPRDCDSSKPVVLHPKEQNKIEPTDEEEHGLKAEGQHLLVEYFACARTVLNDIERVQDLMIAAAQAAGATVVADVFHPFSPQGVSGVVVIEESHLSIHTWPEHGYAAVDFFTCGECEPMLAHELLRNGLQAERCELMHVDRGLLDEEQLSMRVRHHITRANSDTRSGERDSGQGYHPQFPPGPAR